MKKCREIYEEVKSALGIVLQKQENEADITKTDISALCPDISISTIERTLKEMLDAREIQKVGKGRGTGYIVK